jgi:hypothetical protein
LSITEEWLLPTLCSILNFASHTHLASLLIMLLNNLSYFTTELDQSLPSACHSPRIYAQVPDNWLVFLDYLLVIYLR